MTRRLTLFDNQMSQKQKIKKEMVADRTDSNPIEIGNLGSKVEVTVA